MAFTEKGLAAINAALKKPLNTPFTAKDIGFAPATLTALVKDGYVKRHDTKPVSYSLTEKTWTKIQEDMPKTDYDAYSEAEFEIQQHLAYNQLCEYLINKYGKVSGAYFCSPEMKSQNPKIRRGQEGLVIHHIKEDTAIMLCNPNFALDLHWEWQCGENLVYANIFEHALLHMKIVEQVLMSPIGAIDPHQMVGIGGLENFIIPHLQAFYEEADNVLNISSSFWNAQLAAWLTMWRNSDNGKKYEQTKRIHSILREILLEEE